MNMLKSQFYIDDFKKIHRTINISFIYVWIKQLFSNEHYLYVQSYITVVLNNGLKFKEMYVMIFSQKIISWSTFE